jgi:phosphopantothenoylcysteine decarboxylase/phosphopantothenate--cysteine ligase
MLRGKKILLGITGSIAAYKSALLVRLLVKSGAEVKVVMTPSAREFITPLTLSTLSKNPVYTSFTKDSESGIWNNHVQLGLWADLMVIAPASANTLSKMAYGLCDNLLMAVYLSARCPVMFAPAMDLDMYLHPSTQKNIETLLEYGNILIEPDEGELASGLEGKGRMAEPENILNQIKNHFSQSEEFKNKKALITAGPTYEKIDPVRFVGNFSTGKMGIAIADEFANRGADVTLILGPSVHTPRNKNIKIIKVTSAKEMAAHAIEQFNNTDIAVLSAAVADFSPETQSSEKIKKDSDTLTIQLTKTPDILASLGKLKKPTQILIGFALETNNEIEHAKKKLENKNLDFIVLNSLNDSGAGFAHDTNKITIISKNGNIKTFDLKPKKEVAKDIVNEVKAIIQDA